MLPKKITSNPSPAIERPRNAAPGTVMVQKRETNPEPTLRQKLCANCSKPFELTPDQKFYLCPACYRKTLQPQKKYTRSGAAQVLIQITCVECGTVEYLDFVPSDPSATYCRACFTRRKREAKSSE